MSSCLWILSNLLQNKRATILSINNNLSILPILILVISLWVTAGCEKKSHFITIDLLEAAAHGNLNEVKNLLENGTDVDIVDKNGITALMIASAEGYKDIVELLLIQGADINARNNNGETALEITSYEEIKVLLLWYDQPVVSADLCYAARRGDLPAVKIYLHRGIDINAKGNEGLTALIEASQEGKKEVVELLLSKGANINTGTDYGLTALMAASRNGHRDIVELLLSNGAEINIKTKYGDSALFLASEQEHQEVVELLRQHSAAKK